MKNYGIIFAKTAKESRWKLKEEDWLELMDEKIVWVVKHDYADKNRFKKYGKKHHNEVVSCATNLQHLEWFLNTGKTLQQAMTLGYFGKEGKDVYRIGQTGIRSAKETRLYIYARITGPEIQVLTIGDKDTQKEDVKNCKAKAKIISNKNNNATATQTTTTNTPTTN